MLQYLPPVQMFEKSHSSKPLTSQGVHVAKSTNMLKSITQQDLSTITTLLHLY